jgi:hypothetical protein
MLRVMLWIAVILSVSSNLATAIFLFHIMQNQDHSVYIYGGTLRIDDESALRVRIVNDGSEKVPVDVDDRVPLKVEVKDNPPLSVIIQP